MKKGDITFTQLTIALILSFLIVFSLFYFLNFSFSQTKVITLYKVNFTVPIEKKEVTIYIPAVDQYGNGVATKLKVEALSGKGKVLVDINQILFWIDTQQSIQIAKKVAQDYTKLDLSKYDLIYSIEMQMLRSRPMQTSEKMSKAPVPKRY